MPTQEYTLKRHNHKVHPCKDDKKEALLNFLIEKNAAKKILVVTATKTELTCENTNVSIVSDEELLQDTSLTCELMISYDLPSKASKYLARISRTSTYAFILVNPSEERVIHPIETLIGRAIMQEDVEGFTEPKPEEKQAQPKVLDKNKTPRENRAPRDAKREFKPRDDRKPRDNKYNDDKGERKPWEKKERKENKFLGKDENGKGIFSGKSGDRNHRHDGTPRAKPTKLTGKKISIKSLKKKED
ncbi:hypothetical protein JHD48_08265 [Sulfurimonas sp. SAG-AH-194-I05]|nr:hypothetical protein [Sulfurimonas sp. SAG-AH-194-I05]MDF1875727.1 hypothetical protein [Sulfurimonas sp. SAG-AH-194-I05]